MYFVGSMKQNWGNRVKDTKTHSGRNKCDGVHTAFITKMKWEVRMIKEKVWVCKSLNV